MAKLTRNIISRIIRESLEQEPVALDCSEFFKKVVVQNGFDSLESKEHAYDDLCDLSNGNVDWGEINPDKITIYGVELEDALNIVSVSLQKCLLNLSTKFVIDPRVMTMDRQPTSAFYLECVLPWTIGASKSQAIEEGERFWDEMTVSNPAVSKPFIDYIE